MVNLDYDRFNRQLFGVGGCGEGIRRLSQCFLLLVLGLRWMFGSATCWLFKKTHWILNEWLDDVGCTVKLDFFFLKTPPPPPPPHHPPPRPPPPPHHPFPPPHPPTPLPAP